MKESDLKTKYEKCHNELLAIHAICQCIAECPSINASDTWTVKAVKEMALRIQQLQRDNKFLDVLAFRRPQTSENRMEEIRRYRRKYGCLKKEG